MKRFLAKFSDGSYFNIRADRMEIQDTTILAWEGDKLVAYADVGSVLCAYLSDPQEKKPPAAPGND